MLYRRFILSACCCALCCSLSSMAQDGTPLECRKPLASPSVMFLVPADKNSVFWQDVVSYITLASEQLQITLDVHYLEEDQRNRFKHAKSINEILASNPKPDYLITFLTNGLEQDIISRISQEKIFLFSFNAPLTPEIIRRTGTPREYFPYWIGHISPDEVNAGFALADHLIRLSHEANNLQQTEFNLIAISGRKSSQVGQMREQGLLERLDKSDNIQLLQAVDADWSYDKARFMIKKLLTRYENIDIIWTASDLISMAVVDEIEQSKPEMLDKVTIGSIDWTNEIKPYLENQRVAVSYGGHVFEAGWIIPLIFDHYNKHDFFNELGGIISDQMQAITSVNSHRLDRTQLSEVDFSGISKCFRGVNKPYRFNAYTQLESLVPQKLNSQLKSQLDPRLQEQMEKEIKQQKH
ncbi:ABC transporter substrate-binding protein [Shewanella sp. UCD-KL12]|uniref:ABC transporter substrate-binding protein n=1 Tax=Shewanella sp. UCD-KL12 TaxID=1917163 RepID=UPI0009FA84B5|nr:ABC transporter substrate-binding protein [Shewanella sp. UCD-KL12]